NWPSSKKAWPDFSPFTRNFPKDAIRLARRALVLLSLMNKKSFLCLVLSGLALVACADEKPKTSSPAMPKPEVTLDESEWKKRLTPEQYAVTRQAGTERPFGATYEEFEKQGEGTYY